MAPTSASDSWARRSACAASIGEAGGVRLPCSHESCSTTIATVKAQRYQIGVRLLCRWLLHAGPVASICSQLVSLSANGSSLLGWPGTLNFGSTVPLRKYLRIVFRDKPVRRAISWIGNPSRISRRLITLNNATAITPCCLQTCVRKRFKHGSVLDGNLLPSLVDSQR